MWSAMRKACPMIVLIVALVSTGCLFSPDETTPPEEIATPLPPFDSPENVLLAFEILYNDEVRSASQRLEEFQELFPAPDAQDIEPYIFKLQPADVGGGELPPNWGVSEELRIHENIFAAQESREIHSLTLTWLKAPKTQRLDGNWEIGVSNVNLRLLFGPDDGFEVRAGLANFVFQEDPNTPDRWYIIEWEDVEAT